MRNCILFLLMTLISLSLNAQETYQKPTFYIGASYGTSFSIGDFNDADLDNPNAGFAENGQKIDLYGGYFFDEQITLTGTFRYQSFETKVEDIINDFQAENPDLVFTGTTEDWETYYFLAGFAYKVNLFKNFALFPRFGLGPLFVTNPGISVNAPGAALTQNFIRSSETGVGLGYEFGFGLKNDFGKHFSLMPTFTFSGGIVRISDVVTTTDNVEVTSAYEPRIQSFNLGLSLAYRFY
ncbi:MAG TPA: outer membrane beta-barrel protein [Cyclobacteriaceae bacterium]